LLWRGWGAIGHRVRGFTLLPCDAKRKLGDVIIFHHGSDLLGLLEKDISEWDERLGLLYLASALWAWLNESGAWSMLCSELVMNT
jgi:hypothetical protein